MTGSEKNSAKNEKLTLPANQVALLDSLREFGYNKNGYFFIIVSFFGTVFLSVIFDAFTDKLDSIIFKNKNTVIDRIRVNLEGLA